VLDYIARWLGGRFISADYLKLNGSAPAEAGAAGTAMVPAVAAMPRMMPAGDQAHGFKFDDERARRRADLQRVRNADGAERRV